MYTQKIATSLITVKITVDYASTTNSWKTNHAEFFCVRQVYFTNSCQQIWGCLNQPFIIFIHGICGETVLFIIQTSDRMRYFTVFEDKLHALNQDDQSWALSETDQKFPKSPIRPAGSRFYSASCQCGRVFEWTLIESRFNIIANLFLFFCYLMVSVITMCNLIKCLIRTTVLSTPASDVHERWKQKARTSD